MKLIDFEQLDPNASLPDTRC